MFINSDAPLPLGVPEGLGHGGDEGLHEEWTLNAHGLQRPEHAPLVYTQLSADEAADGTTQGVPVTQDHR